eukprot:2318487-Amphidinium_carterae.3
MIASSSIHGNMFGVNPVPDLNPSRTTSSFHSVVLAGPLSGLGVPGGMFMIPGRGRCTSDTLSSIIKQRSEVHFLPHCVGGFICLAATNLVPKCKVHSLCEGFACSNRQMG